MVFNANFNNILVISWRSVLFVEETGVPGENQWPVAARVVSLPLATCNYQLVCVNSICQIEVRFTNIYTVQLVLMTISVVCSNPAKARCTR
jgi:hypothetical protein